MKKSPEEWLESTGWSRSGSTWTKKMVVTRDPWTLEFSMEAKSLEGYWEFSSKYRRSGPFGHEVDMGISRSEDFSRGCLEVISGVRKVSSVLGVPPGELLDERGLPEDLEMVKKLIPKKKGKKRTS